EIASAAPRAKLAKPRDTSDDLLVRVVDPAGNPLEGIPVHLDRGRNDPGTVSVPGPQVTDTSGHARFPSIRSALAGGLECWLLVHELRSAEPPRLTLDPVTLARPEVVSVLPWGGSVEVVVHDLGGAAAPEGSTVQLSLVGEEERLNPGVPWTEWK